MKGTLVSLLALTLSAAPQSQQKKQSQPAQQEPLFKGPIRVKSSGKTKESATMGFNGVDPSGKVEGKVLSASASASDEQKVQSLAQVRPTPAQLAAFLKDGGLKTK